MSPIAEAREALGLSVQEMAQAVGVNYVTWWRAERYQRTVPRRAEAALRELGLDVADLNRRQTAWADAEAERLRRELAESRGDASTLLGGAMDQQH